MLDPSVTSSDRPSSPQPAGIGGRVGAVAEIGIAAAGLGVYLAVLGGMRQWVKLDAAGLPADSVLAGYDTPALVASGARALAVLPIAFCVVLVLVRLQRRERPEPARDTSSSRWDLIGKLAFRSLVGFTGVLIGLTVIAVLAELPTIGGVPRALELALVHGACVCALALLPPLIAAAGHRWRRRRGGDGPQVGEPRWSIGFGLRMLVVGGLTIVAGSAALAHSVTRELDAVGVALGMTALVLVCLPYVFVMVRVATVLERTADDVMTAGPVDEGTELVVVVALASYLLPTWVGIFVVGIFLLVFLAGQPPLGVGFARETARWLPASLPGRVFVVALLVAACALVFQTHQPQRFARATFPVGPGLTADAALLGRADGQLLLGVCQRRADGTSTSVQLIRVPEDRAPAYELVDGGYAFYRKHEGTILSGILHDLGVAFRPPSLRPPWLSPPPGVCGRGAHTPSWVFERLRSFEPPPKAS